MAGRGALIGEKAAVMAEFIYYNVFFCAEKGIEGLA